MEGLQILKPNVHQGILLTEISGKGLLQNGLPEIRNQTVDKCGGINVAVDIVTSEEDVDDAMVKWVVQNLKFSVNEPVKRVAITCSISLLLYCFYFNTFIFT